jgi:hypothetical protein
MLVQIQTSIAGDGSRPSYANDDRDTLILIQNFQLEVLEQTPKFKVVNRAPHTKILNRYLFNAGVELGYINCWNLAIHDPQASLGLRPL